jgi:hypothetical protein
MNAANKIKQDAAAGKGTAGRIQNAPMLKTRLSSRCSIKKLKLKVK